MENFYQYIMTDTDAHVLLPIMAVLAIFSVCVLGRAAIHATRPIKHMVSSRRRQKLSTPVEPVTSVWLARERRTSVAEVAERSFSDSARNKTSEPDTSASIPAVNTEKVSAS